MVRSMTPKFAVKAGDVECFFTFRQGSARIGQNESVNAVLADCNVHHVGAARCKRSTSGNRSMGRTPEIRHRGTRNVLAEPLNMIHSSPTSDPSYAEGIAAAGELSGPPLSTETAHQVLEAQFQIVSGREGSHINQPELRLLMAQNSPMPVRFLNIRRWAVRPTDDDDSDPWLVPSSLISTVATAETITNTPRFLNIRRWAVRPTDDDDSDPWLVPSSPISTVAMPEAIN